MSETQIKPNKLASALLAAQREMSDAVKDSKNPFFKSKYADLNSVREAVTPSLHKYGIALLQPTVIVDGPNGRYSVVRTTLLHESGESLACDTEIVCSKDRDAQALGSAISYARRYGLSSLLSVGSSDDDAEGTMDRTSNGKTTITSAPKVTPKTTETTPTAFGSFRK